MKAVFFSPREKYGTLFFNFSFFSPREKRGESFESRIFLSCIDTFGVKDGFKNIPSMVDKEYIALCERILENGEETPNRTGVNTISVFGERICVDLQKGGFPLLTTRKIFWKGIVRELLWFISGSIDSTVLSKQGVNIWKGNSSREFLDSRGLFEYPEGVIGPGYGWQWRNFGSQSSFNTPRSERRGGVDQLRNVIKEIKANPSSRRLVVSAWNPVDLDKMALPPCHLLFQFHVKSAKYLSCQVYQRSCDVALGLPFNIASYALLTHIIASICDLEVDKLTLCLGDAHIYTPHVEALKEQILQTSTPQPPSLRFIRKLQDIDDVKEEDFVLENYNPSSFSGTMKMVV